MNVGEHFCSCVREDVEGGLENGKRLLLLMQAFLSCSAFIHFPIGPFSHTFLVSGDELVSVGVQYIFVVCQWILRGFPNVTGKEWLSNFGGSEIKSEIPPGSTRLVKRGISGLVLDRV